MLCDRVCQVSSELIGLSGAQRFSSAYQDYGILFLGNLALVERKQKKVSARLSEVTLIPLCQFLQFLCCGILKGSNCQVIVAASGSELI